MKNSQTFYVLLGGLLCTLLPLKTFSARPSQFDEFKGDGYYWYKEDPDEEKPKDKSPAPQPAPAKSTQAQKPLSTEWFRASMPKLLDTAIDNPTKENVANYMYAQRVLLDRSQNFSETVKDVVALDPFLDENNRVPIAEFAQAGFGRGISEAKKEALDIMGQGSGLWVFVDDPDKCPACEDYVKNILIGSEANKGVARQYKFDFRKINIRSPEGRIAAQRLNLKITPTTMLVIPPKSYYLVSQGLMSQYSLAERLLVAARTGGHIPQAIVDRFTPYKKGVIKTEDMNGITPNEDPTVVMQRMRERIKETQ